MTGMRYCLLRPSLGRQLPVDHLLGALAKALLAQQVTLFLNPDDLEALDSANACPRLP